jgi:hypothetical protein
LNEPLAETGARSKGVGVSRKQTKKLKEKGNQFLP